MALPSPVTPAGEDGLRALLTDPRHALVGLDFDGTLSPIVPDPSQARAHPAVPPVLRRLAPRLGRLAVITGRPAELAVDYGALAGVENLVVLGHYGLERWQAGTLTAPADDPGVAAARERVPPLLAEVGAPEGVSIEDKGRAIAVHVRRAADPAAAFDLVRGPLERLAGELGLVVEPGRLVVELRPSGGDKGDALRSLAQELHPTAVMYVGDDLGDLAAFDAVEQLRREGTPGLLVCSGSDEVTALADRADLVVDGPEGVAELLDRLADALEDRR